MNVQVRILPSVMPRNKQAFNGTIFIGLFTILFFVS